jgi:hypothetical protein
MTGAGRWFSTSGTNEWDSHQLLVSASQGGNTFVSTTPRLWMPFHSDAPHRGYSVLLVAADNRPLMSRVVWSGDNRWKYTPCRLPFFLFFIALRFSRVFIALRVTVDQRAGRSRRSTDLIAQRRMFIQSVRSYSRRAVSLMVFRFHVPIHKAC